MASEAGVPPDQLATCIAIALAESGGDPNPRPHHNKNGSIDYGLWQINSAHFTDPAWNFPTDPHWLLDPANNATAMMYVYSNFKNGWGQWATYNNGKYLKHLAVAQLAASEVIGTPGGSEFDIHSSGSTTHVSYQPGGEQTSDEREAGSWSQSEEQEEADDEREQEAQEAETREEQQARAEEQEQAAEEQREEQLKEQQEQAEQEQEAEQEREQEDAKEAEQEEQEQEQEQEQEREQEQEQKGEGTARGGGRSTSRG